MSGCAFLARPGYLTLPLSTPPYCVWFMLLCLTMIFAAVLSLLMLDA